MRPETAEKVIVAAKELDYPKRLPEIYRGHRRIEVILVRPETSFYSRLSRAYARITATLDNSVSVHRTFMNEDDPLAIAERIASRETRRSGLIVTAPDHPAIADAIRQQTANGLPVVQVVSGVKGVDAEFVGIDNYAAGRTAAMFMSRMQALSGIVVGLCHSEVYHVHRERIRGFSDYMLENPRDDFHFKAVLFGHDDRVKSAEALIESIQRWPDLVGLYNAGGGNFGLFPVLRRQSQRGRIFFVGHELTEHSAAALRDGTMAIVFDQAPEAQALRSIDIMMSRIGLLETQVENPAVRFITVTAESL